MKKYVSINVTNDCNLNCCYCYEKRKNKNVTDLHLVETIIDNEVEGLSDAYEGIIMELFGGEPFLEFDMIREVVRYVRSKNTNVIIHITTNGTLVHGEIQRWLLLNQDIVQCCLSLDGIPIVHNHNRDCSFSSIDLDFFSRIYELKRIKMTVTKYGLSHLSESIIFCHQMGFDIDCNLAYGEKWNLKEDIETLHEQLLILFDYYVQNPDIRPCSFFNLPLVDLAEGEKIRPWCGAGIHNTSYDTFGNSYPCQFFMPLCDSGNDTNKKPIFLTEYDAGDLPHKCVACPYMMSCPTCYGDNWSNRGSIHNRDNSLCELNKEILNQRARYILYCWLNGNSNLRGDELISSLRVVKKAIDLGMIDLDSM